ncbi:YihY/virulence factor BrkB family protein [Dactylosporangium sp. AC04546]|uniref:YihY/virulence factor BrkB family protein n=1 Tax=Dactylosporangium sp. AC04546 TaxID=2862460 RepID=UPI001EE1273E|nr:YihY/virulence factor BrkB family protein [Dactylosporangium sp. AC04546]WVK85276.1 YihY/virulence factor BrkB family protein [Dactylosporangium sp. AC04546]
MSSTRQVPETRLMSRDDLSADDAWHALRRYGGWQLLHDSFLRFRYGDGFSHSRALGLQLCLAIVPFLIALSGLVSKLGVEEGGHVVADTVLALTPGASDRLVEDLLADTERTEDIGEFALAIGLLTGMLALTTAMAQIERGANRIYGVERDRPAHAKYARAAVLSLAAGIPALVGFLMLVAGGALGASVRHHYSWGGPVDAVWQVLRWPTSVALVVTAVAAIFRFAPRRRQPAFSWLLFGAALSTALWWLISALLAVYVGTSDAFGATYGALTGIMALLLWANLTGIVLFLGLAFAAQLEARRVGVPEPVVPDQWVPVDEQLDQDPGTDPRLVTRDQVEHAPR